MHGTKRVGRGEEKRGGGPVTEMLPVVVTDLTAVHMTSYRIAVLHQ